jgi:hypothetical protein
MSNEQLTMNNEQLTISNEQLCVWINVKLESHVLYSLSFETVIPRMRINYEI